MESEKSALMLGWGGGVKGRTQSREKLSIEKIYFFIILNAMFKNALYHWYIKDTKIV